MTAEPGVGTGGLSISDENLEFTRHGALENWLACGGGETGNAGGEVQLQREIGVIRIIGVRRRGVRLRMCRFIRGFRWE